MKKMITCLLNIVALAITSGAFCQTEDSSPKQVVTEEWLMQPFFSQENYLLLQQEGTENLSAIHQYQGSMMVFQSGRHNEIYSWQINPSGRIQIRQSGTANQYQGITRGEEIELSILQQGNYNSILQELSGNQSVYEVIQEGSFNQIEHTGNNGSTPLKIQQRGNAMRLIIRSDN